MNIVTLIGNLTKEPNVSYTTSNDPVCVCKMTVAVNEGYGDQQKTSFIPVTVFGRQGENCEKYLDKGSKVAVTGRIETDSYEKDDKKYYTWGVIANRIEFLGGRE